MNYMGMAILYDEWTPEFIDKLGWSVSIKSCVGSFINWEEPFEDVSENNFDPFVVLMYLHHQ